MLDSNSQSIPQNVRFRKETAEKLRAYAKGTAAMGVRVRDIIEFAVADLMRELEKGGSIQIGADGHPALVRADGSQAASSPLKEIVEQRRKKSSQKASPVRADRTRQSTAPFAPGEEGSAPR